MGTFFRRMIGATALNAQVYEEVEADSTATVQAVGVVLLSAAAAGVGARGLGAPLTLLPTTMIAALLAWVAWAVLTYQIGTQLIPGRETRSSVGELLRTLGFASAPGILRVVGIVPALSPAVFALTSVWMLLAMVVAVRQALDYTSTARAFAVCAIGWLLTLLMIFLIGLFMAPGLSGGL